MMHIQNVPIQNVPRQNVPGTKCPKGKNVPSDKTSHEQNYMFWVLIRILVDSKSLINYINFGFIQQYIRL